MNIIKLECRKLNSHNGATQYIATRLMLDETKDMWSAQMITSRGGWLDLDLHRVKGMTGARQEMAVNALEMAVETNS